MKSKQLLKIQKEIYYESTIICSIIVCKNSKDNVHNAPKI